MMDENNGLNTEILSKKSLDDLRKIAISMGLRDHPSLNRGDYYNYIVNGKLPKIETYKREELEKKNLFSLRDIAKSLYIKGGLLMKKSELIDAILDNQRIDDDTKHKDKLMSMKITDLREIAGNLNIKKHYLYKKTELVEKILEAEEDKDISIDMDDVDVYYDEVLKDHEEDRVKLSDLNLEDLSDNATEIALDLEGAEYSMGILEMLPDGYGFLRVNNYTAGEGDIYVAPSQIRRFGLRNGDEIVGATRPNKEGENYNGLVYIKSVNGISPNDSRKRPMFDKLVPIYPKQKLALEKNNDIATRVIDLICPIGKGQRGLIVSQPKSGKTTLLKNIASAISKNYPDVKLIVLLIDERPEEVTDMENSVHGEVISSTFDEPPKNHIRVAEMAIDRAKRLVEQKQDVVILLDSLTRLARAYNLVTPPSGKTLSGGLDPLSLHKPKRFFGAARNLEEGGSLTILATALVETGSKMDDIIFEEFKSTGNMEVYLDRKLSERRLFPAIDIFKSGTRKEELLLSKDELDFAWNIRRIMNNYPTEDVTEMLVENMVNYPSNREFLKGIKNILKDYE